MAGANGSVRWRPRHDLAFAVLPPSRNGVVFNPFAAADIARARGCQTDRSARHRNRAVIDPHRLVREFVMIARDIDQARPLLRPAVQVLQDAAIVRSACRAATATRP